MRYIHYGIVIGLCVVCFGLGYFARTIHRPYIAKDELKETIKTLKNERLEYAAKEMRKLDIENVGRDRLLAVFDSVFFAGMDSTTQ